MKLEDLGYNDEFEKFRKENNLLDFEPGRIIAEYRESYVVSTIKGEFQSEITGNLRFTAKGREDFPAVGDWVAVTIFEPDIAIIHHIFPRYSLIKRLAAGRFADVQLIAANVDCAFLVQSADRDFSVNRLERYLAICYESGVKPVMILSKTDLIPSSDVAELTSSIKNRIKDLPVIPVSNQTREGYDAIAAYLKTGITCCMLGSSGVGKSTFLNNISGKTLMKTGPISESTSKGKHVTSHRELIVLEKGGILIDNPGMREVGIADAAGGLEITFGNIAGFAAKCRFKDCTHTGEYGCAVIEAVRRGEIDEASYENYRKMEKERTHYESTIADRRKKDKQFGKMHKNYKKDIKKKDI